MCKATTIALELHANRHCSVVSGKKPVNKRLLRCLKHAGVVVWLLLCVCCTDTAIKDNVLFSGLPPAGLAAIIDSMQPQMATAGKEIIKQVCVTLTSSLIVILTCSIVVVPA